MTATPRPHSPQPHDLLWLGDPARFRSASDCAGAVDATSDAGALPGWLDADWLTRAPLVVRRDAVAPGRVPVGVRGLQRNQRCKGELDAGAVTRRVTPEMLAAALRRDRARHAAAAHGLPCIAALLVLAPRLDALGLAWGPAGGAGFWLATGLPVLRATSDLDVLVRAPAPLDDVRLAALGGLQAAAPCRLDIQIDTGHGGFALTELLNAQHAGARRVLLKTAHGPLLLADPWSHRDTGLNMETEAA